jgi:hypothetical protein
MKASRPGRVSALSGYSRCLTRLATQGQHLLTFLSLLLYHLTRMYRVDDFRFRRLPTDSAALDHEDDKEQRHEMVNAHVEYVHTLCYLFYTKSFHFIYISCHCFGSGVNPERTRELKPFPVAG